MDVIRLRRWGLIVAGAAVVLGLVLYAALAVADGDEPGGRVAASSPTGDTRAASTSTSGLGSPRTTGATTPGSPAVSVATAGTPRAPESLGATAGTAAGRAANASDEASLPAGAGESPAVRQPGLPADPTGPDSPDVSESDPSPGSDVPGPDGSTPADDVYNSEGCRMFRQLLGMIDDAEAQAAAESLGCI